eukprot:scaffold46372_cov72-Phaeocystis_antarctica.AAC.5
MGIVFLVKVLSVVPDHAEGVRTLREGGTPLIVQAVHDVVLHPRGAIQKSDVCECRAVAVFVA